MSTLIVNSGLWKRSLADRENDPFINERERLRQAFWNMREHAKILVSLIPQDCRSLTVHDITHLDALWEIADLIAGESYELNPAEAFVFGASILIHDAGMTVAAFPGGISEIKKTTEWTDAVYAFYRTRDLTEPNRETVQNPPSNFLEPILFSVLRALHARQAENLMSAVWSVPGKTQKISLLEDEHLRGAYGRAIGKIAHSHHWDIERVNEQLRESIGAATDLPADWTINEKKIACLLRCADAAHIDHRRAPTMLYALTKPKAESDKHWQFQHKINKVTRKDDTLLYSSGEDFGLDEAPAWWLCFDTIKMIDGEISTSNALLQDIGIQSFAATRVYGAESPRILARQIRPYSWQPVNAEVRVSDPSHLARTLGGRNLYGRGASAPIRELLQNSVDAVRARRAIEDRLPSWGNVRLILESQKNSEGEEHWLHVDDNGVGMSERVLVGPLLDFGRSFWNSPLLQEEFPGLESRGIKPIGKFGIGFFSIFMLGERVKVISKPYTSGIDRTSVLEFTSLGSRPILRDALPNELPTDFSTRISVKIKSLKDLEEPPSESYYYLHRSRPRNFSIHEVIAGRIKRLIAAVDVTIEVEDKIAKSSYVHSANWSEISAGNFLNEILAEVPQATRENLITSHERLIAKIESEGSEILGRAALQMGNRQYAGGNHGYISVGGFVYPGQHDFHFLGVLPGDTDDVKRGIASKNISPEVISSWATKQAELIEPKKFQVYASIAACHTILNIGGDPKSLPFCFSSGQFISLNEFEAIASKLEKIHVPMVKAYNDKLEFLTLADLGTLYFAHNTVPGVISTQLATSSEVFGEEVSRSSHKRITDISSVIEESEMGENFNLLLTRLKRVWKEKIGFEVGLTQLFSGELYQPPEPRWCLTIQR